VAAPTTVVVLGPQRHEPNLGQTIESLGLASSGSFATVTAGWEEREDDDRELHEHLWGRTVNLRLHEKKEELMRRDPELMLGTRWRIERLRELQGLYRVRLVHALEAARELFRREPAPHGLDLLEAERTAAIDSLAQLDAEHERAAAGVREEFEARWRPATREPLADVRAELARIAGECACVCVAGGHVAVLLEVLRLFDFRALLGDRPLVCWSAGAMALSERVVLFHDDPPHGAGNAEVLEAGLGLFAGLVPLPHADKRLRLDDPVRLALFARRFRPALCVALTGGSRIDWDGQRWRAQPGTRFVAENGMLAEVSSPA
jgi:hypothetical protein